MTARSVTLGGLLAARKSRMAATQQEVTLSHRVLLAADSSKGVEHPRVSGVTKKYVPLNDSDPDPGEPQIRPVELRVPDEVVGIIQAMGDLADINLNVCRANSVSDLKVTFGTKTLADLTPEFLLYLNKMLTDTITILRRLPVLAGDVQWTLNKATGVYDAPMRKQAARRTEKVPVEVAKATDKHPAQAQLVEKQVQVGTYEVVQHSGAIPATARDEAIRRAQALQREVTLELQRHNSR